MWGFKGLIAYTVVYLPIPVQVVLLDEGGDGAGGGFGEVHKGQLAVLDADGVELSQEKGPGIDDTVPCGKPDGLVPIQGLLRESFSGLRRLPISGGLLRVGDGRPVLVGPGALLLAVVLEEAGDLPGGVLEVFKEKDF